MSLRGRNKYILHFYCRKQSPNRCISEGVIQELSNVRPYLPRRLSENNRSRSQGLNCLQASQCRERCRLCQVCENNPNLKGSIAFKQPGPRLGWLFESCTAGKSDTIDAHSHPPPPPLFSTPPFHPSPPHLCQEMDGIRSRLISLSKTKCPCATLELGLAEKLL